jgi:hypothetical protein
MAARRWGDAKAGDAGAVPRPAAVLPGHRPSQGRALARQNQRPPVSRRKQRVVLSRERDQSANSLPAASRTWLRQSARAAMPVVV